MPAFLNRLRMSLGRDLNALKIFILGTIALACFLIGSDNPNKFLLEPHYVSDAKDSSFNELNLACRMILNEPYWPGVSSLIGNDKLAAMAEITYILPRPIVYQGQSFPMMIHTSISTPLAEINDAKAKKLEDKFPYVTKSVSDPKQIGQSITYVKRIYWIATTENQETGEGVSEDKSALILMARQIKTNCHLDDQWTLNFQTTEKGRLNELAVDGCHNTVNMYFPLVQSEILKETGLDQSLRQDFQKKYHDIYAGTSLCVLDWTSVVFKAILNWKPGEDIVSNLAQAQKNHGFAQNGMSFTVLGDRAKHRHAMYLLLSVLLMWLVTALVVAWQIKSMGKKEFGLLVRQEVFRWQQVGLSLGQLLCQSPALSYKKYTLWRQEVASRAEVDRLNRELAAEEAEISRLKELQRQRHLAAEKEAHAEAEFATKVSRERELRNQLAKYRELDLANLLAQPCLEKDLVEEINLAWEALKQIPENVFLGENQDYLTRLNRFSGLYARLEFALSTHQRQLEALKNKLQKIKELDVQITMRFATETQASLIAVESALQAPLLKPRELRQLAHTVEKIVSQYALAV